MRNILLLFIITILAIAAVQAAQLCQFALSASSTSENSPISLAQYATGPPNAPNNLQCTDWSGSGFSWSPANWNLKGILTLKYQSAVYVSNLTIFGDYDICWEKILLKNSITNQTKEIFNGEEYSCTLTKNLDSTFLTDTIILETCGWAWSSTDAVQLCGETQSNAQTPKIEAPVYIIPYIGDIDGAVAPIWFKFYYELANFFDETQISSTFSFYPGTMSPHPDYIKSINLMYNSKYIELVQKGNNGNQTEWEMDKLPLEAQSLIISQGQNNFRLWMQNNLAISSPIMPITYNHIGAKFTQTTLQAAEELGFKAYLDLYVGSTLAPVDSTQTFDVYQYGVSFTTTGGSGKALPFKSTQEIIDEINRLVKLGRQDLELVKINNTIVIPLWMHQQDFESESTPGATDENKLSILVSTFELLKKDPNVKFITAKEAHALRHQTQINNSQPQNKTNSPILCQFASSASSTSHNSLGSLAQYATGPPNAPNNLQCTDWSGYGYSWTPKNWNIRANLTLKYQTPVYASNLTIFGDYDICFNKIYLKNSNTNQLKEIFNGIENSCTITKNLDSSFEADTIILETCGWSWSSTDSVQLCGNTNETSQQPPPQPKPAEINICNWKDCKKGAASISTDDGYTSCMSELEAKGFRGTYFLSGTGTYSSSKWQIFTNAFKKGHELATHTRSHWCVDLPQSQYVNEINNNINDIITKTPAKRTDLITHAHPCGLSTPEIENLLKTNPNWNFLSARGYHINDFESPFPEDFFNLNSFNTPDFHSPPLNPPDYLDVINQLETNGKWANLIFHNECNDKGAINALPSKSIWVDTIGNVIKYIALRDNAEITDFTLSDNQIKFSIKTSSEFQSVVYNQNLTLQISIPEGKTAASATSNAQKIPFKQTPNIIQLVVPFPISDDIIINLQ